MDIAWLIIDSLSFDATPFAEDGPNTMPELSSLAEEHAVSFTNAYVPGPTSPSSHGSFFTGELPSKTGMHEASPYFTGDVPTIAEALSDSHHSFMISANPFIFNGLYRGFDKIDNLKTAASPLFENATDPVTFNHVDAGSGFEKVRSYLSEDGKPLRSLANALVYKIRGGQREPVKWRFAETINERVDDFVSRPGDTFVVANYMEVHPPLDASDRALERFAPEYSREELPIDVEGNEIHDRIKANPDYQGDDMYALYKAAIWDIDRRLTPLVRKLIDGDTLVIVSADHGNWFRRDGEMDEERIHVPLLVFAPDERPQTISKTVNLRSLPRTTTAVAGVDTDVEFSGTSLLDVEDHQLSITEFIHNDAETGVPVTPSGELDVEDDSIYQIAAIKGDARIDFDGEKMFTVRENVEYEDDLRTAIERLRESNVAQKKETIDYDESTRQRLKELGYLN